MAKFRAACRLTTSTFKITATKFNGFINNIILYPVIRMYETINSTILKISLLALNDDTFLQN